MTRIDFYLMESGDKEQFTCRLINKIFNKKHQLYIHTADEAQAQKLDRLLWTYSDLAFIPHELASGQADADAPVLIGHGEPPEDQHEILLSLSDTPPAFFSRFERVAEVVAPDEQAKIQARDRFRFYRDRGYALETHKI
ncbi:MAG: DNA polymerase III subunit chi [Proteobacteria bacterium]|nr:DNA polymerase III subunit chi [Pseudomonadota bacterium]